MDEDCNEQLVDQRAEVFELYLRDLDARAIPETASNKQEKLEHKNVPVIHEQTLLNLKKLYDSGSLAKMQIWQKFVKRLETNALDYRLKAKSVAFNFLILGKWYF